MNVEKLRRLQSQVRIGGKGTARRKKKVMHQTATTDDKKLQSSLKKLSVSTIPGIEEVNIIKDDLTVIHFNNPKAQASLSANTFAVTGHGETKKIVEMLPEILPQLGQETVVQLRMFANSMTGTKKAAGTMGGSDATASTNMLYSVVEEDDVPMLVSDFDEVAKIEAMKVGEQTTTTNEKPAIEKTETKGESAAVLPLLSKAKGNEKGNNVQPLESLNLSVKSSEKLEIQIENETNIKKQEINTEKENLNRTEKLNIKSTNDVGKNKETQKKNEKKSQQKQEPSRQKSRLENKSQNPIKDSKKPDEIASKTTTLKLDGNREVDESSKDDVTDIIESEKPLQITERPKKVKNNGDTQQTKRSQQKSANAEQPATTKAKEKQMGPELNSQQKQVGLKEKEDKNIEKQGESQQTRASLDSIELVNIEQQSDDQNQTQKLPVQQQQKNESPIKQKNKQPQEKQQNQESQKKTDTEKGLKKAGKQDEKQILKSSKEKPADKTAESKKTSNEKQSEGTKKNAKEASDNQKKSDAQIKSSQEVKHVLADDGKESKKAEPLTESIKQDENQQHQSDSVAKDYKEGKPSKSQQEFLAEEVDKQKPESQQVEKTYKDILSIEPTIETGKPAETNIQLPDLSIKTVALQSLESSEKMMLIVNEIAKDILIENLNNLSEETIKKESLPELPSDQQEAVEKPVESVITEELEATNTSVEKTQEKELNTDNQETQSSLPKTSLEMGQGLDSNVESLNKDSDVKGVIIVKEKLPSAEKEIIADSPSITDIILPKVGENNDKSMTVVEQIPNAQILESQKIATPESDTSGEQLAKQPTLAEIVQSLPPTIPLPTSQIPANNNKIDDVNNEKLIAIDSANKQPSMAEILQSQPPIILPAAVLSSPNNTINVEMKDIQKPEILNKADVKELQLDSSATVEKEQLCQPQDQGSITPELSTSSTGKLSVVDEKPAPISISPKQKASPPKQTTNIRNSNETTKQQPKPSTAGDAKLKLVTKPQPGQQLQQQQSSKVKSKPTNNNKSTPTTPITPTTPNTPTKLSPEKGTTDKQQPIIPATKAAPDAAAKKANSPQKQQQTDTSAKSKTTLGASIKAARPNTGNTGTTSGTTKKANTPPAASKTNANTGGKQQKINVKGTVSGTQTVAEQPRALVETKSVPTTPPTSSPTIENTATSNKPSLSK